MYPPQPLFSSSEEEIHRIQDALQQWKVFNAREAAFRRRMEDLERGHEIVMRRDAILEERRRREGVERMRAKVFQGQAKSSLAREDVEVHGGDEDKDTMSEIRGRGAEIQLQEVESLKGKATQDVHKRRLEAALLFQFIQERGQALTIAKNKVVATQREQESRAQALSAKEECIERMVRRGVMSFLNQAHAFGDKKHLEEMKRYEEALARREEVVALKEELLDLEMKRREERESAIQRREVELRAREESFQRRLHDLRTGLLEIRPNFARIVGGSFGKKQTVAKSDGGK